MRVQSSAHHIDVFIYMYACIVLYCILSSKYVCMNVCMYAYVYGVCGRLWIVAGDC